MPNFEDNNLAAKQFNVQDLIAQEQQKVDKMRADRDALQARINKAPEAVRQHMQTGIDALNAKIVQQEKIIEGSREMMAQKPAPPSTEARIISIQSRLAAAREKPSIALSPDLEAQRIKMEYDELPDTDKVYRGPAIQVPPDQKRAA